MRLRVPAAGRALLASMPVPQGKGGEAALHVSEGAAAHWPAVQEGLLARPGWLALHPPGLPLPALPPSPYLQRASRAGGAAGVRAAADA